MYKKGIRRLIMFGELERDKEFILNKYHFKNEPYNAYMRFSFKGWQPDNGTGMTDEEIERGLLALARESKSIPHPVAKAEGFRYICENSLIDINEHDYFICFNSWRQLLKKSHFGVWQKEAGERQSEISDDLQSLNASGAVALWPDYDHVIPCWDDLLTLGFSGILLRAEEYKRKKAESGALTDEMRAFYDGIIIEYRAILDLLDRYISYGTNNPNEKTDKVVLCLKHLRSGAPESFFDALQAMYIYFIACECIDIYQTRSIGNGFDSSLYRFYKHDLDNRICTEDEIKEYIAYFFMQFASIDNYWGHPLYLGGTDIAGNSMYNELSVAVLNVYEALDIQSPKIQLKVNYNTPDSVLNYAFELVRRHNSSIVFNCEPGMVRAMAIYGVPYEEAYNYEISGCYESRVRGNESSTVCGYLNILKAVRYVFTNGIDETVNGRVGAETGDIGDIKTFADFYAAFIKQLDCITEKAIRVGNVIEADLAFVNPSNMYSGTVVSALENGRDGYFNGVKYTNSCLLCCGFASAVDSVQAVKEFVFDKNEITLVELAQALQNNWQGYEKLRLKIRHSKNKYGNGIEAVDNLASGIADWFAFTVNNRKNSHGGVFKAIMHTAMMFVWQGEKTGATPDGRLAGEEMSKNASPSPGMDKNGVTALIKSAVALKPWSFPESFCLDVMLHPTSVGGDEGLAVLKGLLMSYLKQGGMSLQFNIVDAETLRQAQIHPEKYETLQIRVCGWNVLWNNIPREQQDAYILRAENIL